MASQMYTSQEGPPTDLQNPLIHIPIDLEDLFTMNVVECFRVVLRCFFYLSSVHHFRILIVCSELPFFLPIAGKIYIRKILCSCN